MKKYIIAGVKCMYSFFNEEFFDSRLKEYESDFLDEEGEIIIESKIAKCVLDKNGIYHYIKYKNADKFICLKMSYTKNYEKVWIEQIDHEHKYLSLTDR